MFNLSFSPARALAAFGGGWTAPNGDAVTVRLASPDDFLRQRAFVDGLSRESRYFRYLTGGAIRDDVIGAFVKGTDALVATIGKGAEERIVGNAHFVKGADGSAEFAVAVADGWQGRGLGRELIRRLIEAGRAAGLRRLHGEVLSENRRMLSILRGMGFATERHPGDSMLHLASLALTRPAVERQWLAEDWFAAR